MIPSKESTESKKITEVKEIVRNYLSGVKGLDEAIKGIHSLLLKDPREITLQQPEYEDYDVVLSIVSAIQALINESISIKKIPEGRPATIDEDEFRKLVALWNPIRNLIVVELLKSIYGMGFSSFYLSRKLSLDYGISIYHLGRTEAEDEELPIACFRPLNFERLPKAVEDANNDKELMETAHKLDIPETKGKWPKISAEIVEAKAKRLELIKSYLGKLSFYSSGEEAGPVVRVSFLHKLIKKLGRHHKAVVSQHIEKYRGQLNSGELKSNPPRVKDLISELLTDIYRSGKKLNPEGTLYRYLVDIIKSDEGCSEEEAIKSLNDKIIESKATLEKERAQKSQEKTTYNIRR